MSLEYVAFPAADQEDFFTSAEGIGAFLYRLAEVLFPLNRSLTGDDVRTTVRYLQQYLPELTLHEVASGTQCFDWTVPDEWNVREAWIEGPDGQRVVDFADHNLHLLGYSVPVSCELELDELQEHLYSLPHDPDAIPYVTSYYSRRWGFCLSHRQREALVSGRYRVHIDASLQPGSMTYADAVLPGETDEEVLLSSYICHPSMANNELSGPLVSLALMLWLKAQPKRRYTYRLMLVPETLGAIVYLARHLATLKARTRAGFNLTCVGDERCYSYLPSRAGDTLADNIALHVLKHTDAAFKRYTYLERGSNERQLCAPGVDLPVTSMMRSRYGCYPEYHTSRDNLELISARGLFGGFEMHQRALQVLEEDATYIVTVIGEPQLGKRGLYPTMSTRNSGWQVRDMMNLLAYSDGKRSLFAIAQVINVPFWRVVMLAQPLIEQGLLAPVEADSTVSI